MYFGLFLYPHKMLSLDKGQEQAVNVTRFLALVKKYTEVEDLTPAMLNEFVARINVYAPDKSSGHRVQKVEIIYNCVGVVEIPQDAENSRTA